MSSNAWQGMGLFALLLGVIVLALLGSLVAADRALAEADRRTVALDATGAALLAQRELRLLEERLVDFAREHPPGSRDPRGPALPEGLQWAWLFANSATLDAWPGRDSARPRPADSVIVEVARAAAGQTSARAVVRETPGDSAGILLVIPVGENDVRPGVAIGLVSGPRLLEGVGNDPAREAALVLRSGSRPIAAITRAEQRGPPEVASASIAYPGDPLLLDVAHTRSGRALRTALWLLAVTALAALAAAFWRERRSALSLAGRTSELERLYQEVARSNRMKSEFLANVSHELRTPLNAVVGFVEMLREGVYGDLTPRQALPVDRIAASATHLRHLVDRLLDIAKIAAGRLEVHPEPLVLRPFVLNVASEMESLVSESGLALAIGVSPTLPRIRTDQTHLRQILINLIGNAVKYTPSGGITVDASVIAAGNGGTPPAEPSPLGVPPDPGRSWVALQVSDTGIGIAPADTARIFDEFEQVNAGARTDSARRGTGLGLAISRRLARLLGGELTVVSEPGKGSVFTVWLPVDSPESRPDQN